MDEELQGLLTRIRTEGVDRAEVEAAEIVSVAQTKAWALIAAAEEKATEIVSTAERDTQAFNEWSAKILDQLARDFLISVRDSLEALIVSTVEKAVGEALTPETMVHMLVKLAEAYGARGLREERIEVLIGPEDQERFVGLVMGSYRDLLDAGVEIRPKMGIKKGFRIALADDALHHDFTQEAIASSLSGLLKSPLKEILSGAVETEGENDLGA